MERSEKESGFGCRRAAVGRLGELVGALVAARLRCVRDSEEGRLYGASAASESKGIARLARVTGKNRCRRRWLRCRHVVPKLRHLPVVGRMASGAVLLEIRGHEAT